jgi:hypothetical protein
VGRDGISFSDEPIRAEVAEARAGTLHLFRNHPRPETPVDLVELADRYLQLNSDDTELKTVRDSLAAPAQSARSHAPTGTRPPSGTSRLRMLSKFFVPDGARFRPERARSRLVASSSSHAFSPRRSSLVGLVGAV